MSYLGLIEEALAHRTVRRIVDLGCGDGSLILQLCGRRPELAGFGVDISADAIELARANSRQSGLSDRATFDVADAFSSSSPQAAVYSAAKNRVGDIGYAQMRVSVHPDSIRRR